MAEKLEIIVNEQLGTIQSNFDDLKLALSEKMEVYKNTVYTDETIKDAKSDVADLRKLVTQIEGRRKEIKAKWNEPYVAFEAQVKELTAIINEPINEINKNIEDYERRRVEAKKKEIREYYDTFIAETEQGFPADLADRMYGLIYDSRWENATSTKKAYKEGIANGVNAIIKDIQTIKSFNSEYEEIALNVYYEKFELSAAVMKMNELNAQAEKIRENERRRAEAEAARKAAEEKAAAEAAKAAAEPKAEPETAAVAAEPKVEAAAPVDSFAEKVSQNTTTPTETVAPQETPVVDGTILVRFYASEEQIKDVLEYAAFNEIKAEIV